MICSNQRSSVIAKRCVIQRSPLPELQDRRVKVLQSRTIRRRLRGSTNSCHIRRMAKGWKIVTVIPNPGGASPLQEWALVAIPDKAEAIRAIKARHPHAAIRVDSEADAELLAKYDVRDGKIFVLVEGS